MNQEIFIFSIIKTVAYYGIPVLLSVVTAYVGLKLITAKKEMTIKLLYTENKRTVLMFGSIFVVFLLLLI